MYSRALRKFTAECAVVALLTLCSGVGGSSSARFSQPASATQAGSVFLRFRVTQPAQGSLRVDVGGHLHEGPDWTISRSRYEVLASQWGPWIDVGAWKLHSRENRSGGVAEWPALTLTVLLLP